MELLAYAHERSAYYGTSGLPSLARYLIPSFLIMALIQKGRDHGIGQKVQAVAHGIGVLKTGYDIGKTLWSVGCAMAPYVGRAAAALI